MTDVSADSHALAGAYALNALTEIERAAFKRHLAGCATCALEVAELRETAARLADDAWSVPPPRLRETVLAEVGRTRQAGPLQAGRAGTVPPALDGYEAQAERAGRDGAVAVSRWRRLTVAAAAAGVLAAGAGTVGAVVQAQRVREEHAAAEAARAETARLQAVLSAPDAVLHGTAGPGGGRVTLVFSPSHDAAVVMLADLPAHGPGRSYQLWLIGADGPKSAGVLAAGATADRRLITGVRAADRFGVTVEPAGGSVTPTLSTAVLIPL